MDLLNELRGLAMHASQVICAQKNLVEVYRSLQQLITKGSQIQPMNSINCCVILSCLCDHMFTTYSPHAVQNSSIWVNAQALIDQRTILIVNLHSLGVIYICVWCPNMIQEVRFKHFVFPLSQGLPAVPQSRIVPSLPHKVINSDFLWKII